MFNCECPSCLFKFELSEDLFLGELIICQNCGIELEIVKKEENNAKAKGVELDCSGVV